MLLTDFDALTFDCYGTLIDWECGDCRRPAMWAASF
jgi:FMN phosphatase YigB (HAD superfamily)